MTRANTPPMWQHDALCQEVDPELFFPEQGESNAAAQRVCGACPIQKDCLEWALAADAHLDTRIWGVVGGFSERQRRDHRLYDKPLPYCPDCGIPSGTNRMSKPMLCLRCRALRRKAAA